MTRFDLGGTAWRLKGLLPSAWLRDDLAEHALADAHGWLPATVPGSVQHDLWQAGELDDPYVGRNSLAAEWVAERTWVYARTFAADPSWKGQRAMLRCEGVDYAARFVLNGVPLGRHESMSTPARFDVGPLLRYDEPNQLLVMLAPAPREQDQLGRTSLVHSRKSRMGYWWDFCPRLVHLGLWDAVALELSGPLRIEDVWVRPALSANFGRATVRVLVTLSSAHETSAVVQVALRAAGETLVEATAARELSSGASVVELQLELDAPRLWWPNGSGAQPLYTAQVGVAAAGRLSDQRSLRFGVRSVELASNTTPDPTAPPYSFVVNGERVYINGWNWVPMDALYGVERPAKLRHLLELARAAHVNLLRVNGVGLIERAAFYERCDELGIMLWQEFLLSSSTIDRKPSEDAAYIAEVVHEAAQIVPCRRSHPSLVVWCAGNELESLAKLPLDDDEPVIAALRAVVRRHDPDRLWLPTSARGRKPFNGLSSIRRDPDGLHDVHGPWLYEGLQEQYTLYNAGTALFHSEFGAEGITNIETLRTLLPPEELHLNRLSSPAWRHLSAWWLRPAEWERWFGPVRDLEQLVRATQMLQAEGVRYAIESNRRRVPRNSGSLPWQFNEPYPMAACTSAVDYHGRPKALYHAVAAAFAPLALSARYATLAWGGHERFEAELWACSALRSPLNEATLAAQLVGASGVVYAQHVASVAVAANSPTRLGAIACPLARIDEEVFLLDITMSDPTGALVAATRVCFSATANLAPLLSLPHTELAVTLADTGEGWAVTVRNTGLVAALFVRVADARDPRAPGFARFASNHHCLLPGEQQTVHVVWDEVPPEARQLTISGWNIDAQRLSAPVRPSATV